MIKLMYSGGRGELYDPVMDRWEPLDSELGRKELVWCRRCLKCLGVLTDVGFVAATCTACVSPSTTTMPATGG